MLINDEVVSMNKSTLTVVGDIPFETLKIGDKILSTLKRKMGVIAGLYPVGIKDPFGRNWDNYHGGILMLWTDGTYSCNGYYESAVIYVEK